MEWTRDAVFASGAAEEQQQWRVTISYKDGDTQNARFSLRKWGVDSDGRPVLKEVFYHDYETLQDAQEAAVIAEGIAKPVSSPGRILS